MKDKKLSLPYLAVIPYNILIDEDIQPAAKIFFGCLAGLAKKTGYAYGSNEAFAEMMQTSRSSIKRWLETLEDNGHISRDTKNIPHENTDTSKANRFEWTRVRKIYIDDGFSNKRNDRLKNEPTKGRIKNDPSLVGAKMSLIKKKQSKIKKNNNVERVVVVVSSLEEVKGISENLKQRLCKKYTEDQINEAVAILKASRNDVSNPYGFIMTAIEESYQRPKTNEERAEEIIIRNKSFAESYLSQFENKLLGKNGSHSLSVLGRHVEIYTTTTAKTFEYKSPSFIDEIKIYLVKLDIIF